MDKVFLTIENHVGPLAEKLSSNRYLKAVTAGFFLSTPFVIIGSIFLLLCFLPIGGYGEFMAGIFGENWMNILLKVFNATMSMMCLFVVIGLSNSLAKHYKLEAISVLMTSLISFLVVTPYGDTISVESFGSNNLFLAIIVSIISVEIFRFVKNRGWTIKMPQSVPAPVADSFAALVPALFSLVFFNFVRLGFEMTSFASAGTFISTIFQYPLQTLTGTLPAMIAISFVECLLWGFGIHGSNVTGAVVSPMLTALTIENATATAAGLAPINIINSQFWNNFLHLGGAGATIGLVICMLFFARAKQYKSLGKLAIVSSIFQINEPVIFGFPIILNPLMIIPLIIGPIVNAIIAYAAFATNIVPIINGVNLTWTVPPIVSGFILCGWRGSVLQIILIIVNVFIWLPFFKISDKKAHIGEENILKVQE